MSDNKSVGRYVIIGATPFRGYTNTLTYTSLNVVESTDDKDDVPRLVALQYEECGGLLIVMDRLTGERL